MAGEVRIKDNNLEDVKTIKLKYKDVINCIIKYKVMHTFPKVCTKRKILGRDDLIKSVIQLSGSQCRAVSTGHNLFMPLCNDCTNVLISSPF